MSVNVHSANDNVQSKRRRAIVHRGRRVAVSALCTLYLALSPSCARPAEPAGRDGQVMVETYGGRVEARFPADVSLPALRAAAESTLRARGYVITDSTGGATRFRTVAAAPSERGGESVTVEGWPVPGGSRLRVEPGLFGDETAARSLVDAVLARLGR